MADPNWNVLLPDLEADAQRWDQISAALAAIKTDLDALVIPRYVFDGIAVAEGMKTDYDDKKSDLQAIIESGVTETAKNASALRATKAEYEASEEYAEWQGKQHVVELG